jgi:predicted HAD superfamily Cof-like phosphohydrolase
MGSTGASTTVSRKIPMAKKQADDETKPHMPSIKASPSHEDRVRKFMADIGQPTPDVPAIPPLDRRILRAKLIWEEALETIEALGVRVLIYAEGSRLELSKANPELDVNPWQGPDLEGIVDGCADISVVTMGTLIECGVQATPILEEVDAANQRKVDDGYISDGSDGNPVGKLIKSKDWMPPDIVKHLEAQGYRGEE